jgi:signal transduction histidine kinase
VSASILVLAAAAALAAAIVAPGYGPGAAVVTAALVAALGAPALLAAHAVATWRRRFRSLWRELAIASTITVGVILASVVVAAALMFVSPHDARVVSAIVAAGGLLGLRTSSIVAGALAREATALRDALVAVGHGERAVSVGVDARDEIGDLARSAAEMTARLAEEEAAREGADAARRNLVAAVSHDLRTPIASLRLLVEAVEDEIVDEATRVRYLATMQTHLRSLGTMIEDLFELSRIEAGDIEWTLRRIRLADLVHETVAAMGPEARAKGVEVRSDLADPRLAAEADPERLQRVLFNLIRNAIRHTPADGSVTVRAEPAGDGVEIEVADTGVGIADGDRERVFEAFFRGGPDAARGSDGAGLGLAIARAIVESHGGRIWLPGSGSERGARIRFSLPAGPVGRG